MAMLTDKGQDLVIGEETVACNHTRTKKYISEVTKEAVTVCTCCGMRMTSDAPSCKDDPWADVQEIQTFMPSLEEANTIVNGERQDQYGAPEDSFEIIAGYWNVFLRQKIKEACNRNSFDVVDIDDLLSPLDATNMMVLFKQARKLGQRPKRDNYVDSIGYEAIGADRLWEENAHAEYTLFVEKPVPENTQEKIKFRRYTPLDGTSTEGEK